MYVKETVVIKCIIKLVILLNSIAGNELQGVEVKTSFDTPYKKETLYGI